MKKILVILFILALCAPAAWSDPALYESTSTRAVPTLITGGTSVTLGGANYVASTLQNTGTSNAYLLCGSGTATADNSQIINAAAAVDSGGGQIPITLYHGTVTIGFAGGTGKAVLTQFYTK